MDDAESDNAQLNTDKLYQRVISHGKNSRVVTGGEANNKHVALLSELKSLSEQMERRKQVIEATAGGQQHERDCAFGSKCRNLIEGKRCPFYHKGSDRNSTVMEYVSPALMI